VAELRMPPIGGKSGQSVSIRRAATSVSRGGVAPTICFQSGPALPLLSHCGTCPVNYRFLHPLGPAQFLLLFAQIHSMKHNIAMRILLIVVYIRSMRHNVPVRVHIRRHQTVSTDVKKAALKHNLKTKSESKPKPTPISKTKSKLYWSVKMKQPHALEVMCKLSEKSLMI
jgi:hypothetical protein